LEMLAAGLLVIITISKPIKHNPEEDPSAFSVRNPRFGQSAFFRFQHILHKSELAVSVFPLALFGGLEENPPPHHPQHAVNALV